MKMEAVLTILSHGTKEFLEEKAIANEDSLSVEELLTYILDLPLTETSETLRNGLSCLLQKKIEDDDEKEEETKWPEIVA